MRSIRTVDLFCHVIDHYGDIGVCWRLARQLATEYNLYVRLWIDDLLSFKRICAAVDLEALHQCIQEVNIVHWSSRLPQTELNAIGELVIEGFGCTLSSAYITAMAQCVPQPVWINLEYLSAEAWVAEYHTRVSLYPALALKKYFFFPGFSGSTGGLLVERQLERQRRVFQRSLSARQAFLSSLSIAVPPQAVLISLFCYQSAPVAQLLRIWQEHSRSILCLVPEGVASKAVNAFFDCQACAGMVSTKGALTLQILPFIEQTAYDQLLWVCDFNFVRGEDSFVRAQWATKPFIWHIHPQANNVHWLKLEAFLARYTSDMDKVASTALAQAWYAWNGVTERSCWKQQWMALEQVYDLLCAKAHCWAQQLRQHGDLASHLLDFAKNIS